MNREIQAKIILEITRALESLKTSGDLELDPVPEVYLGRPKYEDHGDLSCSVALRLAKPERRAPMKIAESIAEKIEKSAGRKAPFSKIEVAKPGFMNFYLREDVVRGLLHEILASGSDFGKIHLGNGKRVNVEFVSANPTGPLTVGHGRHAITGDTIANILDAAGYEVTREYYFNNAGNQMNVLGESVRLRYLELLGDRVEFPDTHYQGEYIGGIAKQLVEEHGDSLRDADLKPFRERAETVVFEEIKGSLARIGVVFDRFFNEYDLYTDGKVEKTIEKLRKLDYAYDKDGAVWLKTTEFGLPDDKVIVKSSGEPTYRLPDICYHIDKIDRGYDLIIDIFGQDHHATVPEVQAGVKALGYSTEKIKVLLLQFVTLTRKGEAVKMSTRKATYVTLDEMIDAVASQMRAELLKQYDDIDKRTSPEDFQRMAVDAVRYFYIMRKANAHLDFDLDLAASQSMENPVYYIQYAHARICSIFRKYYSDTREADIDFSTISGKELAPLKEEKELRIIKLLARFPGLVRELAEGLEVHKMHEYLGEVASELQQYYTIHRVINPDDPSLTRARLALINAVRTVIGNSLRLLGISVPERM